MVTSDLDKILFVLSYMSEGDANSWKEEFFDTAEQTAAQTSATIDLGMYAKLITDITKDFSPYDAPKDAIYELKELKMGNNTSIEEHVSKFKMLDSKGSRENRKQQLDSSEIDLQEGALKFLFRAKTTRKRSHGYGIRLYVYQRVKWTYETRHLFYM